MDADPVDFEVALGLGRPKVRPARRLIDGPGVSGRRVCVGEGELVAAPSREVRSTTPMTRLSLFGGSSSASQSRARVTTCWGAAPAAGGGRGGHRP